MSHGYYSENYPNMPQMQASMRVIKRDIEMKCQEIKPLGVQREIPKQTGCAGGEGPAAVAGLGAGIPQHC